MYMHIRYITIVYKFCQDDFTEKSRLGRICKQTYSLVRKILFSKVKVTSVDLY